MSRAILLYCVYGLLLVLAGTAGAQTRDELLGHAKEQVTKQDFKSAIEDLTGLIGRDKRDGEAFYMRAYARHASGDLAGALADYTWAITLMEEHPRAGEAEKNWLAHLYANRGKAKQDGQDLGGALADYDTSLTLRPDDVGTLTFRGSLKQLTANLPGSLADAEAVIRLAPERPNGYQLRAVTRQGQGDFRGAIADFREVIRREPRYVTYSHFFIWGLRSRLGEVQAADDELTAHMKARPEASRADWETKIGAYLLGHLGENEFLTAAATPDTMKQRAQECEARYYMGLKKLLGGDRSAANEHFRRAQATGMLYFTEYIMAGFELAAR
jgi:tetratricopeptide (TPR) repeat protein